VALKVVASHLSAKAAFRERFRREGLLQAAADHPHILPVLEAGEADGSLFLAMRLVRGPNLAELIERQELPLDRALTLLEQVAGALDSAHETGMVHRDVKPQNILVDRGDFAFLADFGITRALDDQGVTRMTRTGEFLGSIHYISPEQIHGLPPTAKSDLYSFAAVLYECLVGRPPFASDMDAAVIYAHISQDPPLVSIARPELSKELDAVLAKGLAKDPEQRYPTARDFVDDARAAVAAPGSQATRTRPRSPDVPRAPAAPTLLRDDGPDEDSPTLVSRSQRKGARLVLVVVAVGVMAVLVASGFAIGNDRSSGVGESAGFAGSGPINLSLPTGWQRLRKTPKIPGLDLVDGMSVGPVGGPGGLTAGRTQAVGPTLLPAAFRSSAQLPKKTAVRLGSYEAYRYRGVRGAGIDGTLTIYAVPTSQGVVTMACFGPSPAEQAVLRACERVAATLELSEVRTYPLGPSETFAASLQNAVPSLDAARAALRRILAAARTPGAQAEAARALADAYSSAASRLTAPAVGPEGEPAKRSIVDALRATEAAHRRLAQAAVAGKTRAYVAASSSVITTEQGVDRALQALSKLGYAQVPKG